MSTWYNNKSRFKSFAVGDNVYVYSPRRYRGRSVKWQSFYRDTGIIERRLNDVSYVVKCRGWKQAKVVHVDKLKTVRNFE